MDGRLFEAGGGGTPDYSNSCSAGCHRMPVEPSPSSSSSVCVDSCNCCCRRRCCCRFRDATAVIEGWAEVGRSRTVGRCASAGHPCVAVPLGRLLAMPDANMQLLITVLSTSRPYCSAPGRFSGTRRTLGSTWSNNLPGTALGAMLSMAIVLLCHFKRSCFGPGPDYYFFLGAGCAPDLFQFSVVKHI